MSHLSLNHLSLSAGGIDALKETLRLYDLPRSPANRRLVDGLVAIDFEPAAAWLPGNPFATFVRGTEVRLTVDECLIGVTRNAARALGLQDEIGMLAPGKACDLAIWDIERPAELVYRIGFNPLHARVWRGR